jgi:(p)ppGpp synthase/HD superfamily hydrolase
MDIERAISIATNAHKGQKDKGGKSYILHPLRVMLSVGDSEVTQIVAVLHDVVEDTSWTMDALREEGFSEEVLEGIDAVTHQEGESYEDFIDRAASNPIGRCVKIADLKDNMDLSRISNPTDQDYARVEKYRAALLEALERDR